MGPRPHKRLLPPSKVSQERILVLLDYNSHIYIEGEIIEFKIGSLSHVSERPSPWGSVDGLGTDVDVPIGHKEEDDDPHILVQQSYPQELPRRGSADLAYLTPAVVPEMILEEPGVQETPSVRSRFLNPDSATVTLPRALPREDTFGELTPRRNKPFPSTGPVFGGHGDDVDLSTSEDEEQETIQSSRFFKAAPVEPNSAKSTADEEPPEASTEGVPGMVASTTSTVLLPRWVDGGKENRESGAEDMRRQFSEAPMITSFTAGSVGASKETSPAAEEEESDRKRKEGKDSNMPTKPMKQGVPEGFLYEEHKKDVTPKQTYGKNRRTPRAKPKGKRVEMDERIERAISEDGPEQGRRGRSAKSGNGEGIGETQETDESEGKKQEISSKRRGRSFHAHEEDAIMETADEEEGQDIAPPARAQGRRGMMSVQSQSDSIANTTEVELGSGRLSRRRKIPSSDLGSSELNVGEQKVGFASTPNPTRPRRGTMKVSDASGATAPATTKSTRKRRRTPEDANQESPAGDGGRDIDSSAESVIHVSREPKSKRAKTTPPNKPAAKGPTGRRGGKGVTPTPPLDNSEKLLGDTQYTFPDVSQTQAMDRVEVKAPAKTPKKTPKMAKMKTVSSTKKTSTAPSTKNKKEPTEEEGLEAEEAEEADEAKTRTRDRYDGDNPKIVFSNSGLDDRKVRTFRPWLLCMVGFTDLEQDIEKFLRANGGKKMQNVSAPGVNFLVVGPGELKRTPKFTISVALGKWVVEDQWLIDSKEVGYFLNPDPYIPHDPTYEKVWSFSLRTAIARGRNGENNILEEHTIYITPALLAQVKAFKQEESLIEMLKTTGASSIIRKAPKGKKEDDENGDKTLILGADKGDNDVVGLEKLGWKVYGTGIVAVSVLRGRLEVGEKEFRIMPEKEGSQTLGRGRKGK